MIILMFCARSFSADPARFVDPVIFMFNSYFAAICRQTGTVFVKLFDGRGGFRAFEQTDQAEKTTVPYDRDDR